MINSYKQCLVMPNLLSDGPYDEFRMLWYWWDALG